MYSWGSNSCGELGLGDFSNRVEITPIPYLSEKNVINFSCGESHVIALGQNMQSEALLFEKSQNHKLQKGNPVTTHNNNTNLRFGEMRKNNKSASNLLDKIECNKSVISDNSIEKSVSTTELKLRQNIFNTSEISDMKKETIKEEDLKLSSTINKKIEENSNPIEQKFYQNYYEALRKSEKSKVFESNL